MKVSVSDSGLGLQWGWSAVEVELEEKFGVELGGSRVGKASEDTINTHTHK